MSRLRDLAFALGLLAAGVCAGAQERFPGIGRAATPAEVAAWDIDVRADFKGLPKGSGSVARGQEVWEAKCASCHGVFGESNQVFNPLVGGTTEADIRSGRVANLVRPDYPGRTTLMKLPSIATLWDYINRAMPWNEPKSLPVEEVYAVTAYMLNLARIVPDAFVLDDANIRQVQERLPNRNGMSAVHGLWPGTELGGHRKADVAAKACMANCRADVKVVSTLPDHARNAHGNLAEQNRLVGPQRGVNTAAAAPVAGKPAAASAAPAEILKKNNCLACHAQDRQLVGPSWRDVARKHAGKADYLAAKIREGGSGVWGAIPMPQQGIDAGDAARVAEWLATGAAP
jgi:S-disulfanyl-L-cysteine oxidoreductase SoxD